jgi:hypothetical protein
MNQPVLLPLIRERVRELLADYFHAPELAEYIVAPKCGPRADVLGALELARQLDSA